MGARASDDRRRGEARVPPSGVRERPHPARGRHRRRVQPLLLARPARPGRLEPAGRLLHGEDRGASRAGSRGFIRAFGCFPVRRGESDREAVRTMRRIVADGYALGLFVEGTRQRSGIPGVVQPGAAMVALQEEAPIVPVAIHGSQTWRPGNFRPVSIAWGEPMSLAGLPKGGRGYKEASALVQEEIRRLFDWLVDLHALGRPDGVPPGAERR
ncbi:MAG: 1-acyl-sn-glycerol-3-phosphate acyltransferase [Gaiella sp.]|nr:1-acyl-sn-glycerol-3-phosphate acyltransferase [Gaiella sp.]